VSTEVKTDQRNWSGQPQPLCGCVYSKVASIIHWSSGENFL